MRNTIAAGNCMSNVEQSQEPEWDSMGLRPTDHVVEYLYKAADLTVQARAWIAQLEEMAERDVSVVALSKASAADVIRILRELSDDAPSGNRYG